MLYAIATFTGRKLGAIGVTYRIDAKTKGTYKEELIRYLYNDYEHISLDSVILRYVSKEEFEKFQAESY